MTKLLQKLSIGLVSATLLGASAASAVFADSTISGNGAGSTNTISVSSDCTSTVSQSNHSTVYTDVTVSANTGGNKANDNTGGSVTVGTGDATAGVNISVAGGSNSATAPSYCLCPEGSVNLSITGNGNNSVNLVVGTTTQTTSVHQKNTTHVYTSALVIAKTGKNKANGNTGSGVGLTTGSAIAGVAVTVTGSSNTTP